MTDITANVIVSMPSQLFTMARSFKAVANGKIYIGKIDTDPVNPENQIQVYIENEDGSHVPVSQPIIINAAGYPVYNGQIAKFVTVQGHSMAVYDAYGVQQFYFPNILKYDPDQLRQELSNPADGVGDALIAVKQPVDGSIAVTQHDKNAENISAIDFGAKGDGVTNDVAALQLMATKVGYIRLTRGSYFLTTSTLDAPVIFEDGAALVSAKNNTVTITGAITSIRQWIFKGDGLYSLSNDTNSGENSREIHASWFGVFPTGTTEIDQSTALNKALSSLGTSREGVVHFDIGRYTLGAAVQVPRAIEIRGKGSRRTIFNVTANGFDVFTPQANGVKFTGIQFEPSPNLSTGFRSAGHWINLSQQLCEVDDVWMGRAFQSLKVTAGQCKLRRISATYSENVGSGSYLISIQGSDCSLEGVHVASSNFGPTRIVEVGGETTSNVSNVLVDNVTFNNPSIGISINTTVRIISGIIIRAIRCKGNATYPAIRCVELKTSGAGTGNINNVVIDGVTANEYVTHCLLISQGNSGSITKVSASNFKVNGSTGVGINFVQTLGSLSTIVIGDTVDVSAYATPYQYSGTMSNVVVAAEANPITNTALCYDYTINDDSVVSIDLHRQMFTGFLMVSVGTEEYAILVIRAAASQRILTVQVSGNVNTTTGVLTGTTGADGKFTVGIANSALYFENRLGNSQRVSVSTLFGIR